MQGSLIKFHILFHCLLDGGQFKHYGQGTGSSPGKGASLPPGLSSKACPLEKDMKTAPSVTDGAVFMQKIG
ncbi:MAG: hypothetical protein HFF70_07045 [Oscillospiraceae bacterium]|jgi:hypothetical protein|nr:hypothetical protein [Oscillospiraceae bacterium]